MPYTIRVEPSGHRFEAQPDESVLDAAQRQGLILPYGCRNGACGTCKGRLRRGRVAYPGEVPGLEADEAEAGLALLCQARPLEDLEIEVTEIHEAGELRPERLAVRVQALDRLNHDVIRLRLQLPRDRRLQFLAGQYVEVVTRDGKRRAYSLANPPHDDGALELHVRYVAGGDFTERVFGGMRVGEVLQIQGPYGEFTLRETSPNPVVLVAGGTGFAPIKALVEHAFHVGLDRPLHLYWGVRAARDLYLPELPERWAAAHPRFSYTPVLSEPQPGDAWRGRTGWVHEAVAADCPDTSGLDVYAAGPPVMVRAVRDAVVAAGLPEARFYSDPFEWGIPEEA
ncbi:MAG: CDP-6-deoxy-delta-3,4-glucoseen reductase [Gammaproteobacteria bacterium]|nr:CDP-6-deoxy-delta-3,4-glucoseen reductase [Gammaproteobacteria bacterium]